MAPALTGCFTVSGQGGPDRTGEHAAPSASARHTGPQGPRPPGAREDLARTGPDSGRGPGAEDATPSAARTGPSRPRPSAPPQGSGGPAPVPEPDTGTARPRRPEPEPKPPEDPGPPRRGGGVCDLGEHYGRWAEGSEQERICRGVYG